MESASLPVSRPRSDSPPLGSLLGFNVVSATLLAILAYYFGHKIGAVIGHHTVWNTSSDQDDDAVLIGMGFAILGWIAGLGFFNYPIGRIFGRPVALHEGNEGGAWRYLRLCTDHKVVALQYLVATLFFFFIAGLNAMFIRAELTSVHGTLFPAGNYLTLVGLHGTMMLMMMSAGVIGPLGNYLVPILIGTRRMAFPRIESLTMWLTVLAGFVLLSATLLGGFPTGWTGYAPLADEARSGIDAYLVSFGLIGISLVLVGLNIIVTVMTQRAPGMTWNRLPIVVWGFVTTSILAVLSAPVLAAALVMTISDRTIDSTLFVSSSGGSPLLWDELFWFFGHPEVYILALPGSGVISEVLPVFARKPIFGYKAIAASTIMISFLGLLVWVHHMFTTPTPIVILVFAMISSFLIAVPTGIKIFNWIGTLWQGSIEFRTPLMYAVGMVALFTIGGLSGIFLAMIPVDWQLSDTYFVVAHIHFVFVGGSTMGIFAAIYYWFPKITGRMLSERLGKWSFWLMFVGILVTFMIQHSLGLDGMPRRVYEYSNVGNLQLYNQISTGGSWILGFGVLLTIINVWRSVHHGTIAGPDPWKANTLEWFTTSPPPVNNFDEIPRVRSLEPMKDIRREIERRSRDGTGATQTPAEIKTTV